DINTEVLKGKKIAVLGNGSQGHAHSLNLREGGHDVIIGLRPGKSQQTAEEDGFKVLAVAEAVKEADIIINLVQNETQAKGNEERDRDNLKGGSAMEFAHAFNVHFSQMTPPENVDVFLVPPNGPGHLVRRTFEEGAGVPALFGIFQDYTGKAEEVALAYAVGVG